MMPSLITRQQNLETVGTASHLLNDVSVVGSDVYVGNGISADHYRNDRWYI